MTINPQKVPYNVNSQYGSVQACLSAKKAAVKNIAGIGPHSCCCYIIYKKPSNDIDNIFGNSRIRVPYKVAGVDINTTCVHGELTAVWNLFAELDQIPTILEMYIEMSPCGRCKPALDNILPDGLTVYYSFDHPAEIENWKAAATKLCS